MAFLTEGNERVTGSVTQANIEIPADAPTVTLGNRNQATAGASDASGLQVHYGENHCDRRQT
jgi:hypothetical protein